MTEFTGPALSARLRAAGFWSLDLLCGRPVQRQIADIRRLHEGGGVTRGYVARRLQAIMRHATESTEFYGKLAHSEELTAYPVIDKETVKTEFPRFQSTCVDLSKCAVVHTSGSHGLPFTCYHDRAKRRRKLADLIHFNELAGYRVGMRHALIRTTPKGWFKQIVQNELWVDPSCIDDELMGRLQRSFQSRRCAVVIGHPSVLSDLAIFCIAEGQRPSMFGLKVFIATSEVLTEAHVEHIRRAFGCRIVSRYATEEFGLLGQTAEGERGFQLNTASFFFEILCLDSDQPVAPGQLGRVVVTDYFSYAMPLIRFDTGDLAVLEGEQSAEFGASAISRVEGKCVEAICDADGRRTSPHAVLVAMKVLDDMGQFQLAQIGPARYALRVRSEIPPELKAAAQARLRRVLGSTAEIDLEVHAELPRLPSGKRPSVVNETPQGGNRAMRTEISPHA